MLRIRLLSYCGFLLIYVLLGVATVSERSSALALRYQLAKDLRREQEIDEQIARAKIVLRNLRDPSRLEKIVAKVSSPIVPLTAMVTTNQNNPTESANTSTKSSPKISAKPTTKPTAKPTAKNVKAGRK